MKQALYQEQEGLYEAKAIMVEAKLALQQHDHGGYTATIQFSAPRHGISLQIKHESPLVPYGFFSFFLEKETVKKDIENILAQELLKDLHDYEIREEIDVCISSLRDQYVNNHSISSHIKNCEHDQTTKA